MIIICDGSFCVNLAGLKDAQVAGCDREGGCRRDENLGPQPNRIRCPQPVGWVLSSPLGAHTDQKKR